MTDEIFPHPQIFKALYALVQEEFPTHLLSGYSETLPGIGTGLELEVVKVLEKYEKRHGYQVHLTNNKQVSGFAGLMHEFDAGVEDREDLKQCLFEVKYRGGTGRFDHENIMKFHHATFEYFLKRVTEQRIDEANVFRCFVTNFEVSDNFRRFFYAWGIALIDGKFIPLPLLPRIFEDFQKKETTNQLVSLIERANRLLKQGYFSLLELVPLNQRYSNILDLNKLNPAIDSGEILVEHRALQSEIDALQQKYSTGNYR